MTAVPGPRIEPSRFRAVLAHLPTSVCVMTTYADGAQDLVQAVRKVLYASPVLSTAVLSDIAQTARGKVSGHS